MRHRWLAICVLGMVMLAKLAVPSGFMVGASHGAITIELCDGYGAMMPPMPAMDAEMMAGMADHMGSHKGAMHNQHGGEKPCPFTALSMQGMASADPLLLAAALAFIIAFGRLAEQEMRVRVPLRLRPPLRGPPPAR